MRAITKIRRSIRAISPVISVLLMIAIAVAASLIAYAWMMGYIGGTTNKAGNAIQIQSYAQDVTGSYLIIYVQNVGQGTVHLKQDSSVYVNDTLYPILTADGNDVPAGALIPIAEGKTVTIVVDFVYYIGDYLRIKVVTAEGTFMEIIGTGTGTGTGGPGTVTHTITVSVVGGDGSISPPGPSVIVNDGASQTFNFYADSGYHVADVSVDGNSVGAVLSYTFVDVVSDHTLSVTFEADAPVTHTITASAGTGGSISPSGSVVVNHGASQGFTITADSNYHILDVLVDGGSVGAVGSYTFTTVVADHTISATFAQDTVQVTFAVDPPGSGTTNPSGTQSYTVGQVVSISASDTNPGDGRVFCYWSATGSITFANAYAASTTATINSAGTITAHFRIPTTMGWYTNPPNIDLGENEDIIGVLYRTDLGWPFGGLNGETVNIVFTAPNGTQITRTATTDWYLFIFPGVFQYSFKPDAVGTWSVYAQFDGDSTYNASKVGPTTFTVAAVPQYTVSFTQTGAGAAPTVTYHIDSNPDQQGTVPFTVQVTRGHQITYSYQSTVSGTTGVQYVRTNTNPSSPQTINNDLTVTGTYKTQYYVTFAVSPSQGGTINRATGWYDASPPTLSITATPNSGYGFSSWSSDTGSITFGSSTSASTTATINGPGTITATFTGLIVLRPNGVGTTTQLQRNGGGANWDRVDDTGSGDGSSTYVYDSDEGDYDTDTYATQDHGSATGTITSVTVYIRCMRSGSDACYGRAILRIGSTNYDGGITNTLASDWTVYSVTFNTNPAGGAWGTDWATIDSMQCGVSLYSGDTYGGGNSFARCTQVWVEVNYTP
jgi:FlaG/FlaF family flagellin (archaellin)